MSDDLNKAINSIMINVAEIKKDIDRITDSIGEMSSKIDRSEKGFDDKISDVKKEIDNLKVRADKLDKFNYKFACIAMGVIVVLTSFDKVNLGKLIKMLGV